MICLRREDGLRVRYREGDSYEKPYFNIQKIHRFIVTVRRRLRLEIKQEHLTQVAFFQHERLVHLIVTITFAILELLTVCAYVIVGAIDSALSMPLLVLAIAILILLVPYIKHYYLLENEVQKMYKQYDRICEKERKL